MKLDERKLDKVGLPKIKSTAVNKKWKVQREHSENFPKKTLFFS